MHSQYFPMLTANSNNLSSIMRYVSGSALMKVGCNGEGSEDLRLRLEGTLITTVDNHYFATTI